jgi:hypothetical protein
VVPQKAFSLLYWKIFFVYQNVLNKSQLTGDSGFKYFLANMQRKRFKNSGLRFTIFEILLSLHLTSTLRIKKSARREKCDSIAW